MGFNSAFKGLNIQLLSHIQFLVCHIHNMENWRTSPILRNFPPSYKRNYRPASGFYLFSTYALQPSRLIVRSGLNVPTFATRRLHACHHARAPSGGGWNCGREMSGNFA